MERPDPNREDNDGGEYIELKRFRECQFCESRQVIIKNYTAVPTMDHVHVELYCPDCGVADSTDASYSEAHGLRRLVDRGLMGSIASLSSEGRALSQGGNPKMAEEIQRFVEALDQDNITPEDF